VLCSVVLRCATSELFFIYMLIFCISNFGLTFYVFSLLVSSYLLLYSLLFWVWFSVLSQIVWEHFQYGLFCALC